MCLLVGEHVMDLSARFRSFAAVCRPGGTVLFSVCHRLLSIRGVEANFLDGHDPQIECCLGSICHIGVGLPCRAVGGRVPHRSLQRVPGRRGICCPHAEECQVSWTSAAVGASPVAFFCCMTLFVDGLIFAFAIQIGMAQPRTHPCLRFGRLNAASPGRRGPFSLSSGRVMPCRQKKFCPQDLARGTPDRLGRRCVS